MTLNLKYLSVVVGFVTLIILLLFLLSPETFGAEPNPTGNPIGGGAGYNDIILQTDARVKYVVTTNSELRTALNSATAGQVVFIPSTATIDISGEPSFTIPSGVILAGDRGNNGSLGGRICRTRSGDFPKRSFEVGGDNIRITGLRIEGADSVQEQDLGGDVKAAIISTDKNNLEVDNCEIYYWSYAGIAFENSGSGDWNGYVHHNYIHHCYAKGYGYATVVGFGNVLIEANLYDYTRHAVSGYGGSGESYEARYNIHGSNNLDSNYDVHANGQNINNWDGVTPGGRLYKIHHNTVPTAVDGYESIFYVAPPTEGMYIYNNKLGSGITPNGGWARCYMTNNYIDGVFHASGQ